MTWKTVWWFPLLERKTGLHQVNAFLHRHGTVYRWKQWREVVLEQSEWQGNWVQTVRLPSGEEIVRHAPQRSSPVSRPQCPSESAPGASIPAQRPRE